MAWSPCGVPAIRPESHASAVMPWGPNPEPYVLMSLIEMLEGGHGLIRHQPGKCRIQALQHAGEVFDGGIGACLRRRTRQTRRIGIRQRLSRRLRGVGHDEPKGWVGPHQPLLVRRRLGIGFAERHQIVRLLERFLDARCDRLRTGRAGRWRWGNGVGLRWLGLAAVQRVVRSGRGSAAADLTGLRIELKHVRRNRLPGARWQMTRRHLGQRSRRRRTDPGYARRHLGLEL
jgi:hypothetical protein